MKNSFGLSLFPGMKTLILFWEGAGQERGRAGEGAGGCLRPEGAVRRLAPRRGADSERTDLVQARPEAAAENPGAPYLCLMTL